ncbi:serine protease family S01A, putative [Phytophthora infestans T30-4]|uniref:Serine protease family S01A, putative n=1 Tax=Phytophthora infestans (strain T30-4) TaxID=403677 RepID=D0NAJ5_PHYIT|nr:serine protease family S01A, putative [Phytophthora infestans T30-4]EEY54853.1 serine protease family S01A, putative [Phytophthora infestans T30-4]|eukprot:XP_002903798.1 serine protease family S01A, putative [Phytophthora infestans T30-4]
MHEVEGLNIEDTPELNDAGEFVAYDLLLHADKPQAVAWMLLKLSSRLRQLPAVQRAARAFVALQTDDFHAFFVEFYNMNMLERAASLRHFLKIWTRSLRMINKGFGKQDRFPLEELARWMGLANPQSEVTNPFSIGCVQLKLKPLYDEIDPDTVRHLLHHVALRIEGDFAQKASTIELVMGNAKSYFAFDWLPLKSTTRSCGLRWMKSFASTFSFRNLASDRTRNHKTFEITSTAVYKYCTYQTDLTSEEPASIYGGSNANIFNHPYMVGLHANGPDDKTFCGGTLIAPQYVITAAHCLDWNLYDVYASLVVTVLGWGMVNDSAYSETLRAVDLHVIPDEECDYYTIDYTVVMCAGTEGEKASCYGDSGGPAITDDVLVGVVSGMASTECGECHGVQLDGGLTMLADCLQKVYSLQTLRTTSKQAGPAAKTVKFQV